MTPAIPKQKTSLEKARDNAVAVLGGSPQSRQLAEAFERLAIEAVFAAANSALPGSIAALARPFEQLGEDKAVQATEDEFAKLAGQAPAQTAPAATAQEIAGHVASALGPTLSGIGSALEKLLAKL